MGHLERKRVKKENAAPQLKSVSMIPPQRLTDDNKSASELKSDLVYFFSTFPENLKSLRNTYKKLASMSMPVVKRFHRRVVAMLDPSGSDKLKQGGSKTGVVIDAEEYIKRRVNEIMIEKAMNNFNPQQMNPVAPSSEEEKQNSDFDVGNYEIKKNQSGMLQAQREPVYKFIPTTAEPPKDYISVKRKGRRNLSLPPTKKRTLVTNAKKEMRNDPFIDKTSSRRLKLLY